MTDIKIIWTSDESECDDCGMNWAEGAVVYFDGHVVLDLMPIASCFDGVHYDRAEVYKRIIEKLDGRITESTEDELNER